MKQLLTVIIAVILFSCNTKQAEQPSAPTEIETVKQPEKKQVDFEALTKILGNSTAFELFDIAGLTEADPLRRGAKKVKNNAVLATLADLQLTDEGGGNYKTTLSSGWYKAGINNGAAQSITTVPVSYCNVTNPSETHPETATGVLICNVTATGGKLGWTMDTDFTVHISNVLP